MEVMKCMRPKDSARQFLHQLHPNFLEAGNIGAYLGTIIGVI